MGDETLPFTQESNKMCWCNNEPWNGRNEFAEPAWGSQIVYCVLDFDDQLLCDSIMLPYDAKDSWSADACDNSECGGYSQKIANFHMVILPRTCQLWPHAAVCCRTYFCVVKPGLGL